MNTIQKNREAALPESAQQRNGAVRSAEAQRSAAGRPARPAAPETRQAAPQKRRPAAEEKQPVPKQKRPVPEKRTATAVKEKPAAPKQKKQAPKTDASAPRQRKAVPEKQAASKKKAPVSKTQNTKSRPAQQGLPDSISTKKRAYGNSKPKKKSALTLVNEAVKQSTERRAEKIKARQAEREKGPVKKNRPQQPAPADIYTEPQAFNRSRFLVQLLTVTAVVVALVLGLSVFFKYVQISQSKSEKMCFL